MTGIIRNKTKGEILADFISTIGYGEIITHEQIATLIGEKHKSERYTMIIQQARKILLGEHKICIESIRGVGYRRVKADDFTKHALSYIRKGFNSVQKGADTLTYAPVADMSEEGRNTHRYICDRTAQLEAALKGGIVEIKTLNEKTHPFSPELVGRR